MRSKVKVLTLLLLLLSSWSIAMAQDDTGQELIGCWYAYPEAESGYSDTMNFYADGSFRHAFSPRDPFESQYGFNGDWVIKDGNLCVRYTSQDVREPSDIILDDLGNYMVEHIALHTETIDPPFDLRWALADMDMQRDDAQEDILEHGERVKKLRITLGGEHWWRLSLIPQPKVPQIAEYKAEWDAYYEAVHQSMNNHDSDDSTNDPPIE